MARAQASAPQAQPAEREIAREGILFQSLCTSQRGDCGTSFRYRSMRADYFMLQYYTAFSKGELRVRTVHV
jgi:hypothetical protein